MGQCNTTPDRLPRVSSAQYDKLRARHLKNARSPASLKILQDVFGVDVYATTAKHDSVFLVELNTLGFVTTNSQPGICAAGPTPLDWDKHLKAMTDAGELRQKNPGSAWAYKELYAESGGRLSAKPMTETSERAYVMGAMMPDEAIEFFDLVNRTDIVCMMGVGEYKVPVTYEYGNTSLHPAFWPGCPPIYTSLKGSAFPLPDSIPKDIGDKLISVECFDPQHGRLAAEYMYPKIILPIMRAIRARHQVRSVVVSKSKPKAKLNAKTKSRPIGRRVHRRPIGRPHKRPTTRRPATSRRRATHRR